MRIFLFLLGVLTAFAFLILLFFVVCKVYRYFDLDQFFYRKEREARLAEESRLQVELELNNNV